MTAAQGDPHGASAEAASRSASETARLLTAGETTSVELVTDLLERIEAVDVAGPGLSAVLEVSPDALEAAARSDAERAAGRLRGPLHGIPVLLKDNIDTVAPSHTTAGSLVFGASCPGADATLVTALRQAGAVVLGKANLSEWANFRGRPSSSGWSAAGGQTRNPHALDRTPGGSSAGSASAVAARLAPLAVGTETDGSILCPAAVCGVAGLKPTVGLVSRTGIVPIASSQDTAGPMARSAEDLALLLEVLAAATDDGEDDLARSSRRPGGHSTHYLALLGDGHLGGLRVGVLRGDGFTQYHPPTDRVFEQAVAALSAVGAAVVDPIPSAPETYVSGGDELVVLLHEFRLTMERYLERRGRLAGGAGDVPRSLDDILAHIHKTPEERLDVFGADLIEEAAGTAGADPARYEAAREANWRRSRTDGLDRLFAEVDVVVTPATTPAWLIDHVIGDAHVGAGWSPPAVAGYPSATLPVGAVGGLPVGIALWGPPWSEALLLRVMFALEKALGPAVTSPAPSFAPSVGLRA